MYNITSTNNNNNNNQPRLQPAYRTNNQYDYLLFSMKLTDTEEACIRISSDYLHRHMVFPPPPPWICVGYEEITTEPFTTHLTTWISFLPVCQKLLAVLSQGRALSWLTMPWVLGVKNNFFQTTRPQEVTV